MSLSHIQACIIDLKCILRNLHEHVKYSTEPKSSGPHDLLPGRISIVKVVPGPIEMGSDMVIATSEYFPVITENIYLGLNVRTFVESGLADDVKAQENYKKCDTIQKLRDGLVNHSTTKIPVEYSNFLRKAGEAFDPLIKAGGEFKLTTFGTNVGRPTIDAVVISLNVGGLENPFLTIVLPQVTFDQWFSGEVNAEEHA